MNQLDLRVFVELILPEDNTSHQLISLDLLEKRFLDTMQKPTRSNDDQMRYYLSSSRFWCVPLKLIHLNNVEIAYVYPNECVHQTHSHTESFAPLSVINQFDGRFEHEFPELFGNKRNF